jgi:AraC-like DNA-binding protein
LRNNPVYRKYKLATLAEEAGFSSSNKFSLIFKKVTSFSPSTFIKYLNEEDLSEQNLIKV